MSDDLRKRVARAIDDAISDYIDWDELHAAADAVLAVVDPDGLRAEVERLRGEAQDSELLVDGLRALRAATARECDALLDERDAAVRKAAALREVGREHLARWDQWGDLQGYADLRALLADPTPDQ